MQVGYGAATKREKFQADYRETLQSIDPKSVLEHYGAKNIIEQGDELIHSCLIDKVTQHHKHGDSSPSASLNSSDLLYNCWSYGGGDVLWFIQEMEGCDRYDALHILTQFIEDTDQPSKSIIETLKEIFGRGEEASAPIPRYNNILLEPWLAIHPYMTEVRGFNESTLQRFAIGYDEEYAQIVIPHYWKGKLVGYQKRRLDCPEWPMTPLVDDKGQHIPKYKNSTGFPKDKTLYNYDNVVERGFTSVVVVESVMSVLRAESWVDEGHEEWGNTICTFAAKTTPTQINILQQFDEIILMLDNDPAGWGGTVKLYNGLKDFCRIKIVDMPVDVDLGDMDLPDAVIAKASARPGSLEIIKYRDRLKGLKKK